MKRAWWLRLVAFALGVALLCVLGASILRTAQGISGALEDPPLAAETYRAPLQGVDSLLFAPAPLSAGQRRRLSGRLDTLSKSLKKDGATRLARYFAGEIRTLARLSRGGKPLEGYPLDHLRANWCRIRASLFDDAAWFRYNESDSLNTLELAPRSPNAAEKAAMADLNLAIRRLEDLAARGRIEADRMGEPTIDPQWIRDHYPPMVEAWMTWAKVWGGALWKLEAEMPPELGWGTSVELRFARGHVLSTVTALRRVPSPSGQGWQTPFRRNWEACFREADEELIQARYWLARARGETPARPAVSAR